MVSAKHEITVSASVDVYTVSHMESEQDNNREMKLLNWLWKGHEPTYWYRSTILPIYFLLGGTGIPVQFKSAYFNTLTTNKKSETFSVCTMQNTPA